MVDVDTPMCIDVGSHTTKVGWGGDDAPNLNFRTRIGYIAHDKHFDCSYIGRYLNQSLSSSGSSWSLHEPVSRGGSTISDWSQYEEILHHAVTENNGYDGTSHPLLMSEYPNITPADREKQIQFAFEVLNVDKYYVMGGQIAAMYAAGWNATGVVLDVGHTSTCAVAMYEGNLQPQATTVCDYGGRDVTRMLSSHLNQDVQYCEAWKEESKACSVSPHSMMMKGCCVDEENLGLMAGELLFTSHTQHVGCHEVVHETIKKCDPDIQKHIGSRIVLAGGSTRMNGFGQRIKNELNTLGYPVEGGVLSSYAKEHVTWVGLSIMSTLPYVQAVWVTKEEYMEEGPSVVRRRCF